MSFFHIRAFLYFVFYIENVANNWKSLIVITFIFTFLYIFFRFDNSRVYSRLPFFKDAFILLLSLPSLLTLCYGCLLSGLPLFLFAGMSFCRYFKDSLSLLYSGLIFWKVKDILQKNKLMIKVCLSRLESSYQR